MKSCLLLTLFLFPKAYAVSSQCEDLISCLDEITGKNLFDLVPPEASLDDFCDAMVEAYQGQKGIDIMCAAAESSKGRLLAKTHSDSKFLRVGPLDDKEDTTLRSSSQSSKYDRHLAAPACQTKFNPAYADDSGSGTSFDTLVAALQGPYLFGGKKERSDADAYSALFIGYLTALNAAAALASVPFAGTATNIALAAVQSTVEALDVHDGLIDATEIQAAFENSQKILTQSFLGKHSLQHRRLHDNDSDNNVATGFATTYSRFDSVDNDLAALSSSVSTGFSNVDDRFDQLEALVNNRLDMMEATLEARFTQLDDLFTIVRTLLVTPDGRRTGWNGPDLICDGVATGNCATVPNFP